MKVMFIIFFRLLIEWEGVKHQVFIAVISTPLAAIPPHFLLKCNLDSLCKVFITVCDPLERFLKVELLLLYRICIVATVCTVLTIGR